MREIKFRAWDGKKMHYEGVVIYLGKAWLEKQSLAVDAIKIQDVEPMEPLLCTGLKDKNGKPIYEGDILKFKSRKVSTVIDGVRQDVIRENLGVVYFDTGKAGGPSAEFNCTEVGGNDQPSWWMCSLKEVIGNIYENPELLEEVCQ